MIAPISLAFSFQLSAISFQKPATAEKLKAAG